MAAQQKRNKVLGPNTQKVSRSRSPLNKTSPHKSTDHFHTAREKTQFYNSLVHVLK